MRIAAALRGKEFGNLYTGIRGIVYYQLSPFEQRPFAGIWTKGFPNIFSRSFPEILYWFPPMVLGTLVYYGVEKMHAQSKRKNPRDFLNEIDPNPPPEEPKECE